MPRVPITFVSLGPRRFDLQKFYEEAGRVLRPGGVLAAWGYDIANLHDEDADTVFRWKLAPRGLLQFHLGSLPSPGCFVLWPVSERISREPQTAGLQTGRHPAAVLLADAA